MDMIKGVRVPERAYRGVLWLVSIVFAAFIVGLGNLVIGDLPLVDQQVMAEPPVPTAEQQVQDNCDNPDHSATYGESTGGHTSSVINI